MSTVKPATARLQPSPTGDVFPAMRRSDRSPLFETPAGFDEPLEMLLGCHRRIQRQIETLKKLRAHLQAHGVDPEATTAAQSLLGYFGKSALDHHRDEESDLFPLLEQRIGDPGEHARFKAFRAALEADHRDLEAAWGRLRKPLEGIAEGLTRSLPADDVQAFASAYAHHILTEENALREFFDRWLDGEDRKRLGRAMAARRQADRPRGA